MTKPYKDKVIEEFEKRFITIGYVPANKNPKVKRDRAFRKLKGKISEYKQFIRQALEEQEREIRFENMCIYGTTHPEVYKCKHEIKLDELKDQPRLSEDDLYEIIKKLPDQEGLSNMPTLFGYRRKISQAILKAEKEL